MVKLATYTQPSVEPLGLEEILSLDLIKIHCKIDDLPGITNEQLELYRQSAFEAAERITGKKWSTRTREEQEIKSPKFRSIAQVAIARISVTLDYEPLRGIVNIYSRSDQPLFWLSGIQLPMQLSSGYATIKLPPHSQSFEMSNNEMFMSPGNMDCSEREVRFEMVGSKAVYVAGPETPDAIPAGIKLGCLKYIAWSVANPGDQFVPMVVRQVGVTTVSNDPAYSSGAVDEWRRHRRTVAR